MVLRSGRAKKKNGAKLGNSLRRKLVNSLSIDLTFCDSSSRTTTNPRCVLWLGMADGVLEAVARGRAVDDWDPVKVSCFRLCTTRKLLVFGDDCAA